MMVSFFLIWAILLIDSQGCHARAGGNQETAVNRWMPACAGMTKSSCKNRSICFFVGLRFERSMR